jgi:type IV pilus assembly protein PilE
MNMPRLAKPKDAKGFTLIELMIVVAIIALLSAIAVPSYTEYVRRSHRVAAKNALVAIAQRLEQNYTLMGSYAITQNPVVGGAPIPINNAYLGTPWGLSQTPPSGISRYSLTFQLPATAPSTTTYTLVATPMNAQIGDTCGALTLDYRNLRGANGQTNRHADTIRCWAK